MTGETPKGERSEAVDSQPSSFNFILTCPICALPRSVDFETGLTPEMLVTDEKIAASSSVCGHVWPLSELQRYRLKAYLEMRKIRVMGLSAGAR